MMGFGVLTGGSPFNDLIGVAVGHLYYFLTEVLPESHGHNPIKTPNWIRRAVLWANNIGVDPRLQQRGAGQVGMHQLNNDGAQAQPARAAAEAPRGNAFRAFGGPGVRIGGGN